MASASDLLKVTDPTDWQGDYRFLRGLDQSLRCELCTDIYEAPVAFKVCGHSFCSKCIRRHVNQPNGEGQFCPRCRQTKAYDSELIPLPALEDAAAAWRQSRTQLADVARRDQRSSVSSSSNASKKRKSDVSPPPSRPNGKARRTDESILEDGDADQHAFEVASSSGERRSRRPRAAHKVADGRRSIYAEVPIGIDDDEDEEDHAGTAPKDRSDPDGDDDLASSDGFEMLDDDPAPAQPPRRNGKSRSEETSADPARGSTVRDADLKAQSEVPCPGCGYTFTLVALNRHIDAKMLECNPDDPPPSRADRGLEAADAATRPPGAKNDVRGWFMKPPQSKTAPSASSSSKKQLATSVNGRHSGASTSTSSFGAHKSASRREATPPEPKKLVRPHYNSKKEKDLRTLLSDAGLSTTGSKQRLIDRHKQWVNLFNANLDSAPAHRRDLPALRKELREWDRQMDEVAEAQAARADQKAAGTSAAVKDARRHEERYKEQFQELIAQARQSAMAKKAKPAEEKATLATAVSDDGEAENPPPSAQQARSSIPTFYD